MLRIDFPRIPWPVDHAQFRSVSAEGRELVRIHLEMARPQSNGENPPGVRAPNLRVEAAYPRWEPPGQLALNHARIWPESVPKRVWQWRLGGYQVLARWLAQRRDHELTADDQNRLHKIIRGIEQTLHSINRIDSHIRKDLGA
jgi:hypothetical protein